MDRLLFKKVLVEMHVIKNITKVFESNCCESCRHTKTVAIFNTALIKL